MAACLPHSLALSPRSLPRARRLFAASRPLRQAVDLFARRHRQNRLPVSSAPPPSLRATGGGGAAAAAASSIGTVSRRAGPRASRHTAALAVLAPTTPPPSSPSSPPSSLHQAMPQSSSTSAHHPPSHPHSFFTLLRSSLSCLTLRLPPTLSHSPLLLLLLFLSLSLGSFFLAAPSSSASTPPASEIFSGAQAGSKTFSAEPASGLAARGMAAAAAAGGGAGPVVADEEAGDAVVVYITVPNKETGQKLAASLVGGKLAACVNRVPGVESTYWWEGKIETDNEELLIVKTRRALLQSIQEHLKTNHPYDVPELIALPIVAGSEAYLKWLHDNAPVPPVLPSA
ncbi:hypothetical protein CLOM_g700 [Closterium sp. NIES-68]|nr:hypothetical protein CLOM_g700 [Closterium sp. NIES-68]GJP62727.1 hypothetical protein CLOP_g19753 [Closterium sp. NIES-67]